MKYVSMPAAWLCLLLLCLLCCAGREACAGVAEELRPTVRNAEPDLRWAALVARLAADGMDRERMTQLFADLALPWSPVFMAAKMLELYGARLGANAQVKAQPEAEPPLPAAYLPPAPGGVEGAKMLLKAHSDLLEKVRARYGTPPELIAAVLLLESDMGHELGDALALHVLASMAVTGTPEEALMGLEDSRPASPALRGGMAREIRKRAAWAYMELRALIRYCESGGIDILRVPGSVYGAIGLCQFMPGNIAAYGVDSEGKGVVDLFGLPDAAHSIGNFLKEHGFAEKLPVKKQLDVLRRYNQSDSYAALVLGMSYQLAGRRPPAELRIFAGGGGPRKAWWPKTRPAYRLPPLGSYRVR